MRIGQWGNLCSSGVGELEEVWRGGQHDQTNYKRDLYYNFRAKFTQDIYEWTAVTFSLT